MAVVPFSTQAPNGAQAAPATPPTTFLMMAAAQMHSEGRLIQPNSGHPEWEPQEPYATDRMDQSEPFQEDKTDDIMRKLEINKGMAKLGYKV